MSNARTVEERASAAQVDMAEQKLHPTKDAFTVRAIIRDRFADVVETDSRVVALVGAARCFAFVTDGLVDGEPIGTIRQTAICAGEVRRLNEALRAFGK